MTAPSTSAAPMEVPFPGIRNRLLLVLMVLVVGATAALSYASHSLLERELAPEVTGKASAVAAELAADVGRALEVGIPFDELVGVVEYFERVRVQHAEMEYILLLDGQGQITHAAGEPPNPDTFVEAPGAVSHPDHRAAVREAVVLDGSVSGHVVIGIAEGFVQEYLEELAYDVLVILLVALLVTYEVLVRLAAGTDAPARGVLVLMRRVADGDLGSRIGYRARDGIGLVAERCDAILDAVQDRYRSLSARVAAVGSKTQALAREAGHRFGLDAPARMLAAAPVSAVDARLPLFVFIFAEELQKSFLPLYVGQLDRVVDWISAEILVGLPISVYMLALAVATPISGTWVDRYGARRIFLVGLVPAISGFIGCALAADVLDLLLARTATAVGYALITIAAQGYMAQAAGPQRRAQGMSFFVSVLMAASVCGTAVGGIVADRLGHRPVFLLAAALALVAGLCAMRMLAGWRAEGAGVPRPGLRLADLALLLSNRRFVALVLLAAIPAKVLLTGFLFYAVPLYLFELGATEAETGRIMMAYSIVIILAGPWAGRIADRSGKSWLLVLAGGTVAGLSMLLLGIGGGHYGVLAAVIGLALGHALSIAPQIALVPDICEEEIGKLGQTTVLGLLRTVERVGSVAGPVLVAGVIGHLGFVDGLAMTGLAVAALSLALLAAMPKR